jgi:predicted RNase H-like HicB family nuclease
MEQKIDKTRDAFDGFAVTIFLDEDGDYLAHLTELPNVSAFGATHAEALDELKTAWELMKECYQRDGIPVPKAPLRKEYEGHDTAPLFTQSTP